tara:strand:+ start:803 stop:1690 length:888 start_codon:yes stop_codon:yes gene_type:complete
MSLGHKTLLQPSFLNAAERFLEKYLNEEIKITKSYSNEEKFDHGLYKFNTLLDDLTSLKICKEIDGQYFLTFTEPENINYKQFIVLQYIKNNLPPWSRRFKRGINYIKDLESIEPKIHQCLGELGIFEKHLSDKAINFMYEIKTLLYSEKDERNNIEIGKIGENLSYNYEYKKTGIKPTFESLKNETSGYDLESYYSDGLVKRIEVKTSTYNRAFITWNEWKVAKMTIANNEYYEFHFWQQKDELWKLAILKPQDLSFMGGFHDDGHHWDKYIILFDAFKSSFKEVNLNFLDKEI